MRHHDVRAVSASTRRCSICFDCCLQTHGNAVLALILTSWHAFGAVGDATAIRLRVCGCRQSPEREHGGRLGGGGRVEGAGRQERKD